MSTLSSILLIIYLTICFFSMFYSLYLYKKLSYLQSPLIRKNLRYPAFNRKDYPKWNIFLLMLGAFFLAPIRIILTLLMAVILVIIIRVAGFFCCIDTSGEVKNKGCFMICVSKILPFMSRCVLFFLGMWWVHEKKQIPRSENIEYFHNYGETKQAVIIGNHVSVIDSFYLFAKRGPISFIASKRFGKFPLFGFLGSMVQCLYVDRSNPESRKKTFETLVQRVDNIGNDPKCKFFIEVRFNFLLKK